MGRLPKKTPISEEQALSRVMSTRSAGEAIVILYHLNQRNGDEISEKASHGSTQKLS